MKKILTLLCLLTCALTGWAAGISETPTTTLTTGYYVIRVFSNKTKADGNLLFFNNNTAYTDAPATTTNSFTTESIRKYIWKVTVNKDNTIQLSSYVAPTYYFGSLTDKGVNPNNCNNIMSTTAGNYTLHTAGEGYPNCFYLSTPGNNTTQYVYNQGGANNNAVHTIGFWSATGTEGEVAKCRFHAVDPENLDPVTITYNIKYNGYTKDAQTFNNCIKGSDFPAAEVPSFVNVTIPSGKIGETTTFDLNATIDMPFKTGNHWYYFSFAEEQGNDHKGYLYNCNYNDATTNYIALGQASGVIEKKLDNDKYLWRIEGDPFGGFKLYVKDGKHLVTPAVTGDGETNYPYLATTPSGEFDTFTLAPYTGNNNTNAVIVRVKGHDTWVMNSRGSKLAYWTGANNASQGSALRFEDTLPELTLHTLGDKSYATYYLPFAAKAPEGVTAYAGVVNNGSVQLTAFTNGVIPANTGALLVANSDVTTATFTLADNSEATTISNDLKGVLTTTQLSDITNSDQVRIFSKKGDVAGFYKPNTNITTLAANKVYVMAPANSTASLALNFGQEITGIDQVLNEVVENNENNAAIYDLTGRRVAKAVKGVYVKNGKKFIVK
uniref:hypothetical protein n=1 Tax=Alloprevotella sp. TaxID=1872471 RepID=UPI00402589CB